VGWRLGECGDKFIGVCTEAKDVMGAEAADFFSFVATINYNLKL
jgi:hypothetical protein